MKVSIDRATGQQRITIPAKFGRLHELKVQIPKPKEDLLWGRFKIPRNK